MLSGIQYLRIPLQTQNLIIFLQERYNIDRHKIFDIAIEVIACGERENTIR